MTDAGTELNRPNLAGRVLKPAAKAAGLTVERDGKRVAWVSFHTFRHTCASLLFEEGRNVKQVVILSFAAFAADRLLAEGFPVDRLPERHAMTRLLFSEHSEVIAIGDPATLIGPPPPPTWLPTAPRRHSRARRLLAPQPIETEDNEGATYSVSDEEWEFYFENLSRYRWFAAGELRQGQNAIEYFSPVSDEPQMVDTELRPLAQTRFGKALGLRLEVLGKVMYRYNPPNGPAVAGGAMQGIKEVLRSGPVFDAVLTTAQLFEALRRKQEGSFDPETFWSAVFAANGVVELPGEKASDGGRLDDRVVGN